VIDRRTFVTLSAGALLLLESLAVRAQQAERVYRIGFLRVGKLTIPQPFWDSMREFGWVEGKNVTIEPRYADREDQLPILAAQLVKSKVDVILTNGTPSAKAAKQATNTIPIVFSVGDDPIGTGLVASLGRPDGNLTGFAYGLYEEKLLEVLKTALPRVARVAYPAFPDLHPAILRAAQALGVQMKAITVQGPEDLAYFYAAARNANAEAVLIPDIAWSFPNRLEDLGAEALTNRLPAIGYERKFAESGGLLSYGPTRFQHWPRLAAHVDKILKGAKPGDLPVEQATKSELVINLKTAKALGLTIPESVLLRADEVIQ